MVVLDRRCVRGVEVSPTERRAAPNRYPRVSRVGAREAFFAGRWEGANVTAYIKRGQRNAAHCGDHDMGEILANAPSAIKGFGRWRIDLSRLWIIGEVGPNAPRQLARRVKNRTVRTEALFGVGCRFVEKRNTTGRVERDCRAVGIERRHRDRLGDNGLPSWASRRRRRSIDPYA